MISEYSAKRCWASLKGRRFDGVNTWYAFQAMEKLGGIENESDHDADSSQEPDLKAYLESIALKKGLEDAISTYKKTKQEKQK